MAAEQPILIAFDGSDGAGRAVLAAAELFSTRPALVVTVWEPGLAALSGVSVGMPGDFGAAPVPMPGPDEVRAVDEALSERAQQTATAGAELAKSKGLEAEPLAVADGGDVADALVGLARERGAAAIVVGSRGLSGLRARLEGSTSREVLKRAPCPVVVVHDD